MFIQLPGSPGLPVPTKETLHQEGCGKEKGGGHLSTCTLKMTGDPTHTELSLP